MVTIIFDLETGGLELHHPIIQIAAAAVSDRGEVVAEFERKVQFSEADADPNALALNHYDPLIWEKEAKPLGVALREFVRFIEPYRYLTRISKAGRPYKVAQLAAFNAAFDTRRLFEVGKNTGIFLPIEPRVLCILQLALWLHGPVEDSSASFKLPDVAERLGIVAADTHDALADCKISAAVMSKLLLSLPISVRMCVSNGPKL